MKKYTLRSLSLVCLLFAGCSVSKQIGRQAKNDVFNNPAFIPAHTGISIYEPATGKYWYNFQEDKYFVPASNTKLFTCYAAMKYLGDSLVAFKYYENGDTLFVIPNGDPTFLHPEYPVQPGFNFLLNFNKAIVIDTSPWKEQRWGKGWSWDDYSDYYAAERSAMPVYGNIVQIKNRLNNYEVMPSFFKKNIQIANTVNRSLFPQAIHREFAENSFTVTESGEIEHYTETPVYGSNSLLQKLLTDTLHKSIVINDQSTQSNITQQAIHSQPTDSMLKPLMHRSDNFFAEQTLLMVSNKLLGVMSDEMIIDTLLKTDFKDLPQKPYWVDGSGLSHYNLFSPKDFVMILKKMKNDFGMDRLKNILATGGTGTITNYYKADSGFIFAKTGTLSGVVALSGFLYTKKNKLLIFSTLVNNHNSSSTEIRKGIEKFIEEIRNRN
ncbi:MAG: D-alanyl-D-alanine carboxypeptidase [Panacibacter sp.]